MKILHVEDYKDWREIVSRALKNYELTSVETLAEAKTAFSANNFDCIICDGTLDENHSGDGIEWAIELQQKGQKVILLSGSQNNLISLSLCKRNYNPDSLIRLLNS